MRAHRRATRDAGGGGPVGRSRRRKDAARGGLHGTTIRPKQEAPAGAEGKVEVMGLAAGGEKGGYFDNTEALLFRNKEYGVTY